MNKEKIDHIYERFPYFRINAIRVLHSHSGCISIYHFEADYIEAYGGLCSPLIHCDKAEKAMVLSTLPYVRVNLTEKDDPYLDTAIRYDTWLIRLQK